MTVNDRSSDNPFDVMADAYLDVAAPTSTAFAVELLIRADLQPGSTVLDVACGTGALAYQAAQRGHTVLAVDTSPGMVTVARRCLHGYPAASVEVMDAVSLSYDAATCDAAFSVLGVSLLGGAMESGLAEMARVVRPGGVVGLVHWAGSYAAPAVDLMLRARSAVTGQSVSLPSNLRLTEKDLVAQLERTGLVEVRSGSMTFIDEPVSPDQLLDRFEPIFDAVPGYCELVRDHGGEFRDAFTREARTAYGTDLMTARATYAFGSALR